MELAIVHIVTVSVLAFLTFSHWSVKEKMDRYVDNYLQMSYSVEDLKDELKSKSAEYMAKNMEFESKKMEKNVLRIIEAQLGQFDSKIIQLDAKIAQLKTLKHQLYENDREQNEMRRELAAKVKQLETRVKNQERLISALKNERPSSMSAQQSKELDDSLNKVESGDFRTCYGIHSVDPSLPSGMYWIDPDGKGIGDDPIYVYCDMKSGTTSVRHDSESPMDVGHCAGTGCYSRVVTYNATIDQMVALAKHSHKCHQSIRYDCISAPFEVNNIAYSWWNDRSGSAQYFWSGFDADENYHTCQCGTKGNCVDPNLNCNCDALDPVQSFDSGVITNKNLLPITALNFGRTQLQTASGVHTLGSFECSGQVKTVMPTSCEDLWRLGHTLNGFYSVMRTDKIATLFCNFQKLHDESEFQKWIGFVDVRSALTFFHVSRNEEFNQVEVPISFNGMLVNTGGAMNLETGIFTANRAGTYFFSFGGASHFPEEIYSAQSLEVGLYVNDRDVNFDDVSTKLISNTDSLMIIQAVVELKPDDRICLIITSKTAGAYLLYVAHFAGWMLEEKLSESLV